MAAWFFAASPMRRSSSLNETNDGVVKLPCSLATTQSQHRCDLCNIFWRTHTDFDIRALVVGNARVGSACNVVSKVARAQSPDGAQAHPDRCRWHRRKPRQPYCMLLEMELTNREVARCRTRKVAVKENAGHRPRFFLHCKPRILEETPAFFCGPGAPRVQLDFEKCQVCQRLCAQPDKTLTRLGTGTVATNLL
jgi:hypothetical protein